MREALSLPSQTPESIARAKQAQQLERAQVTAITGVTLDDDGHMALHLANAIAAACYGPQGEKRHGG